MYCTQCGSQVEPGSRFCSACGAAVPVLPGAATSGTPDGSQPDQANNGSWPPSGAGPVPPPPPSQPWGSTFFTPRTARLVRPRSPRAIAGVCAAFSLYYGWDLVLVRIVTAVVSLFWGVGILAYLICWVAIPDGQYALPTDSQYR